MLVAGCSSTAPIAAPTTPPARTTVPARTTTPAPSPSPSPTPPPVTVDGPCPYADSATVMDIVGQHITRSTVTSTRPHPSCAFYRPNGEKAADVRVSVLASAAAARDRATRLTGRDSNPVDVGDGGTVAITDDGALLAVSAGKALVVVRINQRISLEATEIAKLVVARL
jgi:UPF0176 protein